MEWQSEQEKKESKSIYHSEKEDSYIPIIPKAIEGPPVGDQTKIAVDKEPPEVTKEIKVQDILEKAKEDGSKPETVEKR